MFNWHYHIYFLLLKIRLEAERKISPSSVLRKAKIELLSLYLVIHTIRFNTKLEEKLPASLGGQESLTCLCLLHIIHSFNFLSRSMELVRNSHCYTFSVPPSLIWRMLGAGDERSENPTILKWNTMAVPNGMTKADIKRNPLCWISDQNISYFCFWKVGKQLIRELSIK